MASFTIIRQLSQSVEVCGWRTLSARQCSRDVHGVRRRIVERFDCFRHTSALDKVAKDLFVHSVNFYARKEG